MKPKHRQDRQDNLGRAERAVAYENQRGCQRQELSKISLLKTIRRQTLFETIEVARSLNSRQFGNSNHPRTNKRPQSCWDRASYKSSRRKERGEAGIHHSLPAPLMPLTVHRAGWVTCLFKLLSRTVPFHKAPLITSCLVSRSRKAYFSRVLASLVCWF